jgi:hypothetical protein
MGRARVRVRAFRGSRRAADYLEHEMPENVFACMVKAGRRYKLPLLSSLHQHQPAELDKDQAHQLSNEVETVLAAPEFHELDQDLARIAAVARWCARSRQQSWLTIISR